MQFNKSFWRGNEISLQAADVRDLLRIEVALYCLDFSFHEISMGK